MLKTVYSEVPMQGRQSTSTTSKNITKVKGNVHTDCLRTIHDVCEEAETEYGTH